MATYNIVKVFHSDHGVSAALQQWAVEEVAPKGFFLATLTIPENEADLVNNLHGPANEGDEPVTEARWEVRDPNDSFRQMTRVCAMPSRPTRLLTVIGMSDEKGDVTLFTAYGGPAAERIPSDPSIKDDPAAIEAAEAFWRDNALSDEVLVPFHGMLTSL